MAGRGKKKTRHRPVLALFFLLMAVSGVYSLFAPDSTLFQFVLGKPWDGVVIDPGHGGSEPGAVAQYNGQEILEKDLNLDIARRLADCLTEQGVGVVLTRQGDSNPGFVERAGVANKKKAALFVSIHLNSNMSSSPRGIECYYPKYSNDDGIMPAMAIGSHLTELGTPYRGELPGDFTVLMSCQIPAVLLELGFMSNSADLELLMDPAFRQKLAEKTAQGIMDYRNQKINI